MENSQKQIRNNLIHVGLALSFTIITTGYDPAAAKDGARRPVPRARTPSIVQT